MNFDHQLLRYCCALLHRANCLYIRCDSFVSAGPEILPLHQLLQILWSLLFFQCHFLPFRLQVFVFGCDLLLFYLGYFDVVPELCLFSVLDDEDIWELRLLRAVVFPEEIFDAVSPLYIIYRFDQSLSPVNHWHAFRRELPLFNTKLFIVWLRSKATFHSNFASFERF